MGFRDEYYIGVSPLGRSVAACVDRFIDGAEVSEEEIGEIFKNDGLKGIGTRGLEVFETFEGFMDIIDREP